MVKAHEVGNGMHWLDIAEKSKKKQVNLWPKIRENEN